MGLFDRLRGRGRRGGGRRATLDRGSQRADLTHLEQFVATRSGVKGTWSRGRRSPRRPSSSSPPTASGPGGIAGPEVARRLSRELTIPVYDAQVTGYPQRMREWSAARPPTALTDRTFGAVIAPRGGGDYRPKVRSLVGEEGLDGGEDGPDGDAGAALERVAPGARCCCSPGPAMSMCAHGELGRHELGEEVPADEHPAHPVGVGVDRSPRSASRCRGAAPAGSGIAHMPSPLRRAGRHDGVAELVGAHHARRPVARGRPAGRR